MPVMDPKKLTALLAAKIEQAVQQQPDAGTRPRAGVALLSR